MSTTSAISGIPKNYQALPHEDGHIGLNGPYYADKENKGRYGFWADQRHANPVGVVHGALLSSFIDTIFGHHIMDSCSRPCATISMTCDYLSAAPLDSWIEGRVKLKKTTGKMAFISVDVTCGENSIASASAVFRLF